MDSILTQKDSDTFNQFRPIDGASQAVSRKMIKIAKIKISEILKELLKINDLKPLEQNLVNQILARTMTDRIGKYTERYNAIIRDYFILSGIIYQHNTMKNKTNSEISDEDLDKLLEEFNYMNNSKKENR